MNIQNKFRSKSCRVIVTVFFALITIFIPGVLETFASVGEKAELLSPPISAGSEIGYPPFCVVDSDGQANGFSVELMRAALKAMGREVTFRTGPWTDVKNWLEQGDIQALPLVGRTPEREPVFDFTFPYMSFHGAIVVRQDTTDIQDISDLSGRQVAVMKGDNAEEFVRRKDRGFTIHTTATFEDALRELSDGLHDAVIIQRLVALRLIQETGLTKLRVLNKPLAGYRQDWCFAVREGDRDTLSLLNEGLSIVIADGTYSHLHSKWFAALELPSNRRIVIGGDNNYPPFEYLDENGRPKGYNVDLTRAIAREVGLDIEIRLGSWADIQQGLARGEIDAIQGMLYSTDRGLTFDFTPPHTAVNCVGVVRKKEGPPPTTIEALKGKRIIVQQGDIMHEFAIKNGLSESLTAVATQEEALRKLARGQYDCALVARIPAMYFIKHFDWKNLSIGQHAILTAEYGYAVPKNKKALLSQLREGMKVLEEKGEYRRIYEKWLGVYKDSPLNFVSFLRYAAIFIVPVLLLLLSVFLWSWSLRRQVLQRTAELAKSRKILNETGKMGKIGGWEHDLLTGKSIWTEALFDILEIPCNQEPPGVAEQISYYTLRDQEILEKYYNQSIADGTPFDLELEVFTAGKKLIWCRVQGKPEFENDKCVKMRGTFQEITERKRAEEDLVKSEMRLRTLVDSIPDLVWLKDQNGIYLSCNPIFEQFFGAKKSEIIGKTDYDFVDTDLADFFRQHDQKAMAAGRPSINEERLTFADNGYEGLFETIKSPMHNADGDLIGVLGIARDISIRKTAEKEKISLERQLKQSQKMEAIGTLAGGIAHDFNNILSSIIGFTELAIDDAEKGTPMEDNLQEVYTAGIRAKELVSQILILSRHDAFKFKPIHINAVVIEAIKMLRSIIPSSITIQENISSRQLVVHADPTQIHQVIVNLATNAKHAMSETGGILMVDVHSVSFDENLENLDLPPGNYARITVSDTGTGIDKEHIIKIFEPYFTTKAVGEGSGLGLAVTHGIIKSHNGEIAVHSEPGKGTTFNVYLPMSESGSVELPETSDDPLPRGMEQILMVDDEPSIVKMQQQSLERLGYTVTASTSSVAALEMFCAAPDKYDLIITDMTMPDMTGDKFAEAIKKIRSDIPIILNTGFSDKINIQAGHNLQVDGFLIKPVNKKTLAITVRKLLDETKN
jgi:PAS domain S-box-containing protein